MSVSLQPKYSKSAEVVHGLQVRHAREGGVSQTGKPLKSAEVVHGLQVRDEMCIRDRIWVNPRSFRNSRNLFINITNFIMAN